MLSIEALSVEFPPARVVRDVSLTVSAGECLGVVGETGSGKSQIFLAAMGLLGPGARAQGSVKFQGRELLGAPRGMLEATRGAQLAMIFQDPLSALTPHLSVGVQMAEVLVRHRGLAWRDAEAAALTMLRRVALPEPERRLRQYPHELSGGMRQRVLIGMSLLCEPALVIADEPTTALDVTLQAQVIELLRTLRRESALSLVLISHDLAVVVGLADRLIVVYAGRVVETLVLPGPGLPVPARHPYTAALVRCAPNLAAPVGARMPTLPGQPPDPLAEVVGCAFAPRCPRADDRCRSSRPALESLGGAAAVACHHPLPA
jgi:oligopeptide/dipeptide ABC transporter ATP-binding protein